MKVYNKNLLNSNMHYFYYAIDFFFETQKRLGLNEVALYGCVPHIWIDHQGISDPYNICDKVVSSNIRISLFIPKQYFYFISSTNENLIAKSIQYYKNCIDFCAGHGIEMLYINSRFTENLDMSVQKEQHHNCLKNISEYAEKKNVKSIYDEECLKSEGYIILTDSGLLKGHSFKNGEKVILLNKDYAAWDYPDKCDEENMQFLRGM